MRFWYSIQNISNTLYGNWKVRVSIWSTYTCQSMFWFFSKLHRLMTDSRGEHAQPLVVTNILIFLSIQNINIESDRRRKAFLQFYGCHTEQSTITYQIRFDNSWFAGGTFSIQNSQSKKKWNTIFKSNFHNRLFLWI